MVVGCKSVNAREPPGRDALHVRPEKPGHQDSGTAAREAGATPSPSGQGAVHFPASKRATGMSTPSACSTPIMKGGCADCECRSENAPPPRTSTSTMNRQTDFISFG